MNEQIHFDSSNWDSIKDTIKKINAIGCMQFAETEAGEDIIFDVGRDEAGDYLITDVFQSNGWIRRTTYHPTDFRVEETYKKE